MKKIILSIALMVCAVCAVNAQAFSEGSRYVGLGIGFGGGYGVPVSVTYEQQAFHEKVGLGGIIGYAGSSESNYYGKWSYNNILIGVRSNYHFAEHLISNVKWDFYGGLILGYNVASSSFKWNDPSLEASVGKQESSAGGLIFGGQVGARYCFSDTWAAFAEVGYGIGTLSLGVNYSF